MVLTHPELDRWHRLAIRNAVGPYGIGIVFVPLYREGEGEGEREGEDEVPVLKPLDPKVMASFPVSFGQGAFEREKGWGTMEREMKIEIDVDADVEARTEEIVRLVKGCMGV